MQTYIYILYIYTIRLLSSSRVFPIYLYTNYTVSLSFAQRPKEQLSYLEARVRTILLCHASLSYSPPLTTNLAATHLATDALRVFFACPLRAFFVPGATQVFNFARLNLPAVEIPRHCHRRMSRTEWKSVSSDSKCFELSFRFVISAIVRNRRFSIASVECFQMKIYNRIHILFRNIRELATYVETRNGLKIFYRKILWKLIRNFLRPLLKLDFNSLPSIETLEKFKCNRSREYVRYVEMFFVNLVQF